MDGATIVNSVALPNPGPQWQVIGAGDFYDTGYDDTIMLEDNNITTL